MQLLVNLSEDIEILTEATMDGKKNRYIHGIFMQSNKKNRNGRIYPKQIMESAVNTYIKDYVKTRRAISELNHPLNRMNVNPREASHLITDLYWDGDNVIGKAKILSKTPMGAILEGLLEGGVQMGVSSRGAGSVKSINGIPHVQGDFRLAAIDAVSDPSAHETFVESLMESANWIYQNGVFFQDDGKKIEESVQIIKNAPLSKLEEAKLQVFQSFLQGIK